MAPYAAPHHAPEQDRDRDRFCTPHEFRPLIFRQFRGPAGLDPCYDPTGLRLARRLYDLRRGQDGLSLPWSGRVWLNPPYSNPAPWLRRAALHHFYGLAETLAIVNVSSASAYWRDYVWRGARAICFLHGRVSFLYNGRIVEGNRYDQAVLYYGWNVRRFRWIWRSKGAVVRPSIWRPPRLTERSASATLGRMQDETLHEEDQPSLMAALGPAVLLMAYSRVKHLTVQQLVERALPVLEEFVSGYQLGRTVPEEEDPDDVTFDIPPANGRDAEPPWTESEAPKPKKKREPRKKTTERKPKAAKAKGEKKAPKKPPKKTASSSRNRSPYSSAELDEHVFTLLKARGDWAKTRDLEPLIRGVNANQLRKSLARLVEHKKVETRGATKSKEYCAAV